MYEFKQKTWILYPSEVFDDDFHCILSGELVTIVAESNSWKTTFALDLIERNAERWVKWFYINLEFPMETMWQSRWLWFHNKNKSYLSNLQELTEEELEDMKRFVSDRLSKYKYYNSPNWISMQRLSQVIEVAAMDWYKIIVIDSFSMIHGNSWNDARGNQNKCMQELQELAQKLDVAIIILHHTNRHWTWEWSQKIMDLSNVMIVISKEQDMDWEEYRNYALIKDKYVTNKELDIYYYWWKYVKNWLWATGWWNNAKPF